MYERVVGRGEEGTERFKRGNENKKKKVMEKSFWKSFLALRLHYHPLFLLRVFGV